MYFSIIRNTVSCFQGCFPQPMMSACVKWAKEEVDAFNAILARQLSGLDRGGDAWHACVDRARMHAHMLEEVHLDFRDLVGRHVPPPQKAATAAAAVPAADGPIGLGLA